MHTMILRIYPIMAALLLLPCLGTTDVIAAEPKATIQQGQVEMKELHISNDGKALVDQNGQEIARFNQGIQMTPTEGTTTKLQGCMCCEQECIAWDSAGNCVKKYSNCTWDFDCSCKK